MAESVYCSGKDYLGKFDTTRFLDEACVLTDGRIKHMLRCFHSAFRQLPDNINMLDYGSGPSLLPAIAAATKASEIVLSDYSENNREAICQWLRGDCKSFDWTPHFEFVVYQLEDNKSENAVQERKKKVRKTVKAVVHCDLTQDPIIQQGYSTEYDVVISSLVVDTVPNTYKEFVNLLSRLGKLVKREGALFLYFAENVSFYTVGNYTFKSFPLTQCDAERAVAAAGFKDIKISDKYCSQSTDKQFFFMEGIRI